MNWWQIQAYITAKEHEENERLVLLMNVMAVAFAGDAKARKAMTEALVGSTSQMPVENLTALLDTHLASPVDTTENSEVMHWAAGEFDPTDPAFKVK
jgi:hypothetical protein